MEGGGGAPSADEVAEVFEFDGEVDAVDDDVFGDVEDGGGEVEDGLDAGFDEGVGDFLGAGGGDGEDGHLDLVLLDEAVHGGEGEDGDGEVAAAGFGGDVEGGDDFETFFAEAAVAEEGGAEVPDADEDDGLETVVAEDFADGGGEAIDVVAEAAGAELAEVGEVFAELGGFDTGGLGERFGGDGVDVVHLEALEAALVDGESVDRLSRDVYAWHL